MKKIKARTTKGPVEADPEEKACKKKSTTKSSLKTTLNSLQEKDPEFYQFLKQQDADLLNFDQDGDDGNDKNDEDLSDENQSGSDDDDNDQPDTDNECVTVDEATESKRLRERSKKKYKKSLEEALDDLDESADEEDEDDATTLKPLSSKLLKSWEAKLRDDSLNLHIIKQLALAFRSFIQKSGCSVSNSAYQLNNAEDCELVLRLCFDYFPKVWQSAKKSTDEETPKLKSKLLKPVIKEYVCDLIKFLPEIQDNALLLQVLKHIRNLSDYCAMFPRKSKLLLKALIRLWNSQTKKCKFFAFQCIKRLVEMLKDSLFIFAFKRMYLTYSQSTTLRAGCEMTSSSENHVVAVDFMQKSFAELCQLDPEATYQNAFVYIRQLAVDLRNSIITKKKETFKTVYSRKYANLLYLWSVVLSSSSCRENENLKQLIYPLVQVVIGSCRNAPSAKYLPFRLHCIRCLLILTKNSQIFVPVFSMLTEVLNTLNVGKSKQRPKPPQNSAAPANPINLNTAVKLSKSQLDDVASYKPLIVEKVFDLLIEALRRICGSPAFTESTFLLNFQLKKFCKDGRSIFSNQIRQLSRKLDEHSQWMELYKAKYALNLRNADGLLAFETECLRDSDNLLLKYCESCKNLSMRQASVVKKPVKSVENSETKNRKRPTAAKSPIPPDNKKAKIAAKTTKSDENKKRKRSNDDKSDFAPDIVKDFDMSDLLVD